MSTAAVLAWLPRVDEIEGQELRLAHGRCSAPTDGIPRQGVLSSGTGQDACAWCPAGATHCVHASCILRTACGRQLRVHRVLLIMRCWQPTSSSGMVSASACLAGAIFCNHTCFASSCAARLGVQLHWRGKGKPCSGAKAKLELEQCVRLGACCAGHAERQCLQAAAAAHRRASGQGGTQLWAEEARTEAVGDPQLRGAADDGC